MDDGLILNLATDSGPTTKLKSIKHEKGRWTDRLKAKRVTKRKSRSEEKLPKEITSVTEEDDTPFPPLKRPRRDNDATIPASDKTQAKPAHIISSLFSYNPKIAAPAPVALSANTSLPSNAPLDSSAFSTLGLNPLLVSHLTQKMNILKPTAIQRAALPAIISQSSKTDVKDVFIQSQTGSGKTLSFLLPIIQDLLPLSSLSYIDRSIGTLAIIITPTRELAKQISDVLENLLKLRLRPEDMKEESETSTRLTRWLVSGLLIGGATRAHEKARLRKGIPILVSTPGRLLDHIQNTSSFNVGKCRWLVLDEADRLMELGFEDTIKGIIQGLDGRRKLAIQAVEQGQSMEVGGWDWGPRRRTILCSATIREDVQKLAGTTLVNPMMIKATEFDKEDPTSLATDSPIPHNGSSESFTPPSQLIQKYVVVPLKLRLVALVALLRTLIAQGKGNGNKIVVFLSCTDSVDFHWTLLGGSSMRTTGETNTTNLDDNSDESTASDADDPPERAAEQISLQCPFLPGATIYRLHGSLPTSIRLATIKEFIRYPKSSAKETSSVLICTSVASRGLDLPLVRAVVQYDLPTEGGATEYIHRVGRTARAGKGGEAWSILLPSESDWVKWVEEKMAGSNPNESKDKISLQGIGFEKVLKAGLGGANYEERATEVQMSFEHWVLRTKENAILARKAFLSHMRAYATHPSNEKHIFHIRHLHIGHLAKAFALREAPKTVTATKNRGNPDRSNVHKARRKTITSSAGDGDALRHGKRDHNQTGGAEGRMQAVVRAQGRLSKKKGMMISSGVSEFQIAGGDVLEKLVNGR